MLRKQGAWFLALLTLAMVMASSLAGAQTPNYPTITDYPLGGGSTTGQNNHNGSPNTSGLAALFLGWYAPGPNSTVIVDNTDFANTTVAPFVGGPYDFNSGGSADSLPTVSASNNSATSWASPTFQNTAAGAFDEVARQYAVGTLQANGNLRFPPYSFTNCTPAAAGTDPTQAATPNDLRYFDWNYKNTNGTPALVTISVNIPQGPTQTSGGGYNFPVEFYVYQVFYYDSLGNQQNFVQVVDSYAVGTGFFTLAQGGVFPSNNGPNGYAIKVRLLNTVPRDPSTGLLLQLINGQPIPPGQEGLVKQFLVYADATEFAPSYGTIVGSATSASLQDGTIRVAVASNFPSSQTVNGVLSTSTKGVVSDYLYNNTFGGVMKAIGQTLWTYSPLEQGAQAVNVDNTSANWTTGFTTATGPASHQGADYLVAPVSNTGPMGTDTVTYTPNLVAGTYQIYAFIPGNATGQNFATKVRYDIIENANPPVVTTVWVNQSVASGWVQIGTGRYNNFVNGTNALKVVVYNYSPLASDAGTFVYADAVRFVGASDDNITATPIHARALIAKTPGGAPTLTDVVVVFDENGVIHCLDAEGNANGTTTEYWSYPSTPNGNNAAWADPNTNPGNDPNPIAGGVYDGTNGTTLAEMPTGFGTSGGFVQRIGNADFLYVTTTNGRVYCIAMAGRGDYNASLSLPGTTQRVWTFPATYPSPNPIPTSSLGAFQGSPAFATLPDGTNALFVPTTQGRMYALNATGVNATTTTLWNYPAMNQPVLGPIAVTPSVDSFGGNAPFPMLFFGTEINVDNPAQFFAINATNGNVVWTWNGIVDPNLGANVPFLNFLSSPCTVSGAILNSTVTDPATLNPSQSIDTVYTINSNGYVYAFNAETGAVQWQTNELNVNAQAALSYAVVTAPDFTNSFTPYPFPMLLVPATTTQNYYGLFARTEDVNFYGTKEALNFPYAGQTTTSAMTNSNGWLYGADSSGFLYAFDAIYNAAVGYGPAGSQPGSPVDSITAREFSTAKIRIITQTEFNLLQAGGVTYAQGTPPNGADPRNPVAFDWGESAYVEVYDFPYADTNSRGGAVPPPIVNVTVRTPGSQAQTVPIVSQQFVSGSPTANIPNPPPNYTQPTLDGYAVHRFPFMPSGANAIPPGSGSISASISTYSAGTGGALTTVMLNPAFAPTNPTADLTKGWSQLAFTLANPLAIEIPSPTGSNDPDQSLGLYPNPSQPGTVTLIGNPTDPQNSFNGSFNLPGAAYRFDLLQATPGQPVGHGQATSVTVNVYDRSLLGLIFPGQGIPNVFADVHDFGWQGGGQNVVSPLSATLYPNMEDLPNNFPNTSLDYPNITRDSVRITANPTGNAQNPLIQGVTLNPPLYRGAPVSPTNQPTSLADREANEVGVPTPFQYQIQIPRFQPANEGQFGGIQDEFAQTSPSQYLSQGYTGRFNIFAKAAANGARAQLVTTGTNSDTYRSFNLSVGVAPDWNLVVSTPNVNLGQVSAGQGYNPLLNALTANGTVGQENPWQTNTYYQPFQLLNEGNVNLVDLRLVKGSSQLSSTGQPIFNRWGIFSANNDTFGFLDSYMDVWSSMDAEDAPANPNDPNNLRHVVLQKARVADLVPTSLSVNPTVRQNPNLGVTSQTSLYNTGVYPAGPPLVGVSVPIGLPVGNYSQVMRVVENYPGTPALSNEFLDQVTAGSYEAYSDPGFTLSFTVTETRLTGNAQLAPAPATGTVNDPMLEAITPVANSALGFSNLQPAALRDSNGGLVTAWASNRPQFAPAQSASAVQNPAWRIYLAGIGNATKFAQSSFSTPATPFSTPNPLGDLDYFIPFSQGTWMTPSASSSVGYPNLNTAELNALFLGATPSQTIANVSFGSPAFPNDGMVDTLQLSSTPVYSDALMGFVGEAQLARNASGVANAVGSSSLSRLFLAQVQSQPGSGAVTVGAPVLIAADDSVRKGKPSIVQRSNNTAMVFYPGASASASDIYYTLFNGTTATPPYPLDFGSGFLSVDSVSAQARMSGPQQFRVPLMELTFTGKLRGDATDEVFLGRLGMKVDGTQLATDSSGNPLPFQDMPAENFEQLSAAPGSGVYRSKGIDIDTSQPIHLVQVTSLSSGLVWSNILMDGYPDPNFNDINGPWDPASYVAANDTHTVDRTTGIIAYDTRVGGKVYIDPALGTVKFVGGTPSPSAVLRLSYQARFLRVSGTGQAYSSPSGLYDIRTPSDPLDMVVGNNNAPASFVWRVADSGSAQFGDDLLTTVTPTFNDRYVFTYNKAPAAGSSQAARPYMSTQRFAVKLNYPIYVAPNGTPGYVQVQWPLPTGWGDPSPVHYYQIDPANGKIYFEDYDDGSPVRVTYLAADPATGAMLNNSTANTQEITSVALMPESPEAPILINQAVNEQGLDTFLDPFNYGAFNNGAQIRPPLMWLFWSSTRNGVPDVYFETLSPMLIPRPVGVNQ